MPEMGTSGLMSGDGKRDGAVAPVLAPILDSTGIPRRTSARTPTWQPERSLHGGSGAFLEPHYTNATATGSTLREGEACPARSANQTAAVPARIYHSPASTCSHSSSIA